MDKVLTTSQYRDALIDYGMEWGMSLGEYNELRKASNRLYKLAVKSRKGAFDLALVGEDTPLMVLEYPDMKISFGVSANLDMGVGVGTDHGSSTHTFHNVDDGIDFLRGLIASGEEK